MKYELIYGERFHDLVLGWMVLCQEKGLLK